MKPVSPKGLPYSSLALVAWLMEKEGRVFAVADSGGGRLWLYETVPGEDGGKPRLKRVFPSHDKAVDREFQMMFGGTLPRDFRKLFAAGMYDDFSITHSPGGEVGRRREEFRDAYEFGRNSWPFWLRYKVPLPAMREWWEREGRDLHAEARAAKMAELKAAERYVLLGGPARFYGSVSSETAAKFPKGFRPPAPALDVAGAPLAFARVVRETANRLYLEEVTEFRSGTPVEGSHGNRYCAREAVIADNLTLEEAKAAAGLRHEIEADLSAIAEQAASELLPVYRNMADRLAQKQAEYEWMLKERLGLDPESGAPKP